MKKPTLAQLKKRPALWVDMIKISKDPLYEYHITHPCGDNERWMKDCGVGEEKWRVAPLWSIENVLSDKNMEFVGWL